MGRTFVEAAERGSLNYGEAQSKMNLIAGRIERHASSVSQNEVNTEVLEGLNRLASKCRDINSITIHMNVHQEIAEEGEEMMEIAEELEETARTKT